MLTPPSINGIRTDFASIRARVGGFSISELFRALNYEDELTPGVVEGAHPIPVDTTLGRYKASGSFEMLEEEFYKLINTLGDGYGMIVFPITVTKLTASGQANVDQLMGCRIMKQSGSYAKNEEGGLIAKVDLYIQYIKRNGRTLVPLALP